MKLIQPIVKTRVICEACVLVTKLTKSYFLGEDCAICYFKTRHEPLSPTLTLDQKWDLYVAQLKIDDPIKHYYLCEPEPTCLDCVRLNVAYYKSEDSYFEGIGYLDPLDCPMHEQIWDAIRSKEKMTPDGWTPK